ncbi:THAP domain-containing protein 7-like [Gymnodraco acuticeps]|uniref:THAP domain-containing protein 1 n=1 Tax=Gymnodraco acuticeps TaxID=8218 RepID=A0A6P8T5H5_GYMAC|nr:THAP domain-containing protein 7-like [Gymnodraco acuticeps]
MPRSCSVPFCTTNKLKNPSLKFYILPNGSTEPRRRTRWLQAIRREDELGHLWDPKSKHVYVCSQHFITGLKNEDIAHPDYTPSLFPHKKTKSPRSVLQRLERRRKREGVQSAQPESPTSEAPIPLQELERKQLYEELYNLRRERDEAMKERAEAIR